MSGIPYKLDGLDGDNEVRAKFTSFYASMALSKGDAVCIDVATTTNGIGNHVTQADVDAAATKQAIGIAAEAIASGDVGLVQVGGVCTFAKLDAVGATAPGDLLGAATTAGELAIQSAHNVAAVAINLIENVAGTDGTADCTVYLLNPLNL